MLELSVSEKESQVRKLEFQIKEFYEELNFEKEKAMGVDADIVSNPQERSASH